MICYIYSTRRGADISYVRPIYFPVNLIRFSKRIKSLKLPLANCLISLAVLFPRAKTIISFPIRLKYFKTGKKSPSPDTFLSSLRSLFFIYFHFCLRFFESDCMPFISPYLKFAKIDIIRISQNTGTLITT